MLTFLQALSDGGWIPKDGGYFSINLGDVELCLEPLLFDGQFYLAAYDKKLNLLFEKIVIKPGKI